MSFTCEYCCGNRRVSAGQNVEDYRTGVITLLCQIAAGGGGGGNSNVNLVQVAGVATSVGAGAADTGTQRIALATGATVQLVAGTAIAGKFGIDQTTPGTTNGVQLTAALPAGSAIIGNVRIDQTTPGTTNGVQVNAALPAGSNLIGKTGIDQTTPGTTNAVVPTVVATGGWTPTRVTGGLSTTVTQIKGSAGKLGAVQFYNSNSAVAFVQIFNSATAGAVTLGTTAPGKSIGIPPLQSYAMSWADIGVPFSAGIQVAATTTETGSSAPTTPVTANFDWT